MPVTLDIHSVTLSPFVNISKPSHGIMANQIFVTHVARNGTNLELFQIKFQYILAEQAKMYCILV